MFVVQPHPDDAILGIGQLMLEADIDGSTLVTAFTASPDPYPLLMFRPHDEHCGFEEGDDVMAVRRDEDLDICKELGWRAVHIPLLDVQYWDRPRPPEQAELFQATVHDAWIDAGRPEWVWSPAAVSHPDHLWVLQQMVGFARGHRIGLKVWLEPGYRSRYHQLAAQCMSAMVDVERHRVLWNKLGPLKFMCIRGYESQLNGITALALADALEEEVWGTWAGT